MNSALASVIADGTRDKLIEEWLANLPISPSTARAKRRRGEGPAACPSPLLRGSSSRRDPVRRSNGAALFVTVGAPSWVQGVHCAKAEVITASTRRSRFRITHPVVSAAEAGLPIVPVNAPILVAAHSGTPTSTWLVGDGDAPSFGEDVRWPRLPRSISRPLGSALRKPMAPRSPSIATTLKGCGCTFA